jgi:hypothetical protein
VDEAQKSEILCRTNLQEALLQGAQLQGAALNGAQLQGATLWEAQLQGADLQGANIGSADFRNADLTWSDLRGLVQAPLDKKTSEELEKMFTDALSDTGALNRGNLTGSLKRLQDTVGRPTDLSAARAKERSVLCDNVEVFRFCVPPEQIAGYADDRARFLVNLGCKGTDAAIARSIMLWYPRPNPPQLRKDPRWMAFAKHVTLHLEKDCPGWAALSADTKDSLRTLAAGENTAPK